MEIAWILILLFLFMTALFVVFAVFFPEWIGITGKKARDIQREQEGSQRDETR